jgi:hypothetical protein
MLSAISTCACLDQSVNPHVAEFQLLIDRCDLVLHITSPMYQLGGTPEAVISRQDAG